MATKSETRPKTSSQTLRIEKRFNADPRRVFRAFTDPAVLKTWWGPAGCTTPRADLDVRPGGAYAIDMKMPDGAVYALRGTFREVTEPSRLVYTWSWGNGGYAGIETLVTLEFVAEGKGTLLRVTHTNMTDDEMHNDHRDGWTSSLARLEAHFAGAPA